MKRSLTWPVAAAVLLAIATIAWWMLAKTPAPVEESQQEEGRVLYWYDPMVPDQHFDAPGKSPFMDMELVPKYADEDAPDVVAIDPRMAQNLGVRTAFVRREAITSNVSTVGIVEIDEARQYAIESRAAGWVERLDVRVVGDPVGRGQRVAGIYSPELYAAQSELVLAAQSGDDLLLKAARERLSLLGVAQKQVDEVLASGRAQRQAIVAAPSSGIVTELNVREGQQTAAGMPLMRIADLSTVWIVVDVPETQAAGVRAGSSAQARLRALPGKVFTGEVSYVYPQLAAATRTLRARLVFDNPERSLRPGMFADVTLGGPTDFEALVVPTEALIRTGTRTVVIVAEAAGRFHAVAVDAGPEAGDVTAILSGLEAGQEVVVSGQFLLDSEASLRGTFNRLGSTPAAHGDHP